MLALKGYFNGNEFVTFEKVDIKKNQKVIITVLDEYIETKNNKDKPYMKYVGVLDTESVKEIQEALEDTEKVDKNEW